MDYNSVPVVRNATGYGNRRKKKKNTQVALAKLKRQKTVGDARSGKWDKEYKNK